MAGITAPLLRHDKASLSGIWTRSTAFLSPVVGDLLGRIGLGLILLFAFLYLFGPALAPYEPFEVSYLPGGTVDRSASPSVFHLFGTNSLGQDIFSQVLHGARITITVGILSAIVSALLGTNLGLIAGYFGGKIDAVLMRLTDVAYGIPFLPFALILVSVVGASNANIIVVITLFMWRNTARIVRAQVLSLRERPFVLAARASGASSLQILYSEIAPGILPLALLYVGFGVAWGVLVESSLSFLGFGDPTTTSWGQILSAAFRAGATRYAWWWVVPPGGAIALLIISVFLVVRGFEEALNPRLRRL